MTPHSSSHASPPLLTSPLLLYLLQGATVILLLIRLVQGLAAGGELVSAFVYTVESAPPDKVNFWASMTLSTANWGCLLGAVVVAIVRASISKQDMFEWGWRIPFWAGIAFGLGGIWLRKGLGETHGFEQMVQDKKLSGDPLKQVQCRGTV